MDNKGHSFRAVLVDDVQDDLKYAQRLTRNNLVCDPLLAKESFDELRTALHNKLSKEGYDVAILDYRLDDAPSHTEATAATYRGGSVAAELKEQFPDKPVVLLTTKLKLEEALVDRPRVRNLFDLQVLKGDLRTPTERDLAATKIADLARGFARVAASAQSVDKGVIDILADAMDATTAEKETIAVATKGTVTHRVDELSGWILREAMEFPGLLLDVWETRALLGLTEGGFEHTEVQELIDRTRYTGVFTAIHKRWWRSRIEKLLEDLGATRDRDRAIRIAKAAGIGRLVSAKCVWCDSSGVTRACSLCHRPVDSRHHLPSAEPKPGWAEPSIACFDCIQTGAADETLFDVGVQSFVQMVRDGKVDRPGQGS